MDRKTQYDISEIKQRFIDDFPEIAPDVPWQICYILKYVRENIFAPDLSVASVRGLLKISNNNFSALFSNYVAKIENKSFRGIKEYILHHRLRLAKYLLTKSNYQISTIAVELGFSDTAAFTNAFKRKMNITPAKYREMKRKK